MGALVDELSFQAQRGTGRLRNRLGGITDDEYFWEPVSGSWSVRRREEARGTRPEGRGAWILDNAEEESAGPPFTTIAWRLMHLVDVIGGYHMFLWGDGQLSDNWLEIPPTAPEGVSLWDHHSTAFTAALAGEEDSGLQQMVHIPWWPQEAPRWRVVANVITEISHHGAEIGVLRDLYRQRADLGQ
jgi:uncharacterized damage-inducible protein DinB